MRIAHIATLAAVTALSTAKPHRHVHRHAHAVERDAKPDNVKYEPAVIETVVRYILDGHVISADEVRQGLANGTLEWGADGKLSTSAAAPVALPTAPPATPSVEPEKKPEPQQNAAKPAEKPEVKPVEKPAEKPAEKPSSDSSPKVDTTPKSASELVDKDGKCASCDTEFPNNKIPCSQFPYGYGAMPLDQEGLGGWSGIQDPGYRGADGYDDIRTVASGSCKDGSCCTPGSWCSYGCPNPYLKLSFPKMQGRTGQTVGGLYCNSNGMLEMADGSIGKTLCGPGSQHMTVKVQNKLSKSVSICRTDYPGTESMTFPLTVDPGETGFLANPDAKKYFFWQNKPTSAHYYVNKQGISEADACTWSNPNQAQGNWAPTIFGTSWDDINMNVGFSGLQQNELRRDAELDYSITFIGDAVSSPCSFKKKTSNSPAQYCQGTECWSDFTKGCTASTKSGGTLTLVLHDD